jgi:hypothetical protein
MGLSDMRSVTVACGALALSNLLPSTAFALDPRQCLPMADMNAALRAEGQRTIIIGDRLDYERQSVTFAGSTMTRAEWRDLTRDIRENGPQRRRFAEGLRREGRSEAHIEAFFARLLRVSEILERGDPDAPVPRLMTAFTATEGGAVGYVLEGDRPAGAISTRVCIRARLSNLRLPAAGGAALLDARGDVQQINGAVIRGLNVSLRGTARNATFLVIGSSATAPLFYMSGVEFTPVGSARRGT